MVVAALAFAVAWKRGLLDGPAPWTPPPLESGLTSVKPRPIEPPRIKSSRFGTACKAPAPVYVYAPDATPSAFLVLLVKPVADPSRVADSLTGHYGLRSHGYAGPVHGFVVEEAGPNIVSRLRCEPAVSSLEESATVSR